MAYLALLEDLANNALRRERVFQDRADLLGDCFAIIAVRKKTQSCDF